MKAIIKGQTIQIKNYGIYCVIAVTGCGSDEKSAWLQKVGVSGNVIKTGRNARLNLSNKDLNQLGYTNNENSEKTFDGYDVAKLQREIAAMSLA
jgi:hypothetical protein